MQARHFLEVELSQAIKQCRSDVAEKLIDQILDYELTPKPSLASRDEQGNVFIFQAIEIGLKSIVDKLWQLQRTNSAVILNSNNEACTLGWRLAASGKFNELLTAWLIITDKITTKETAYPFWMTPNKQGYTLLHAAVRHVNEETVELLLHFFKKRNLIKEILHARTTLGDTSLHFAMSTYSSKVIAKLLQHDAQLTLANNDNITPLDIFIKKHPDTQIKILTQANALNQSVILQRYYAMLQQQPDDEKIKTLYFSCAQRYSLSALLLGKFECAYEIPAEAAEIVAEKKSTALELLKTQHESRSTGHHFKLPIEDDREHLNILMQDIELKLVDWLARTTPLFSKVKAVVVPGAGFMSGGALFAWKMTEVMLEPKVHVQLDSLPIWHLLQYILLFMAALILFIVSLNAAIKYSPKWFHAEPIINRSEWEEFYELLKQAVLVNMRVAAEDGQSKAPWRKIGQDLLALEPRLNEDLEKSDAIEVFQSVNDKLAELRTSLSLSNRPFAFFAPPPPPLPPKPAQVEQADEVIIEIDDEAIPLLPIAHA